MPSAKRFTLDDADPSLIPLPPTGETLLRDTTEPRLALRLRASGARTWVMLGTVQGKTKKQTLGDALLIPIKAARTMAAAANLQEAATSLPPPCPPDATISDLMPLFLEAGTKRRWKRGTLANMHSAARHSILPELGKVRVWEVTAQQVARWYLDVTARTKGARMALSTLSGLMLYAEDHGLRKVGSNPCRGLRRKMRGHRGGLLTPSVIRSLWEALHRLHDRMPDVCDAVRLLLLTGARRSEILGLQWDRITEGRAVLEDSKTGPRVIWLNAPARVILDRRRICRSSGFVFPAPRIDGPIQVIDWGWRVICKEAGISSLRVHDLRHHFASLAVSNGIDLRIVGQLLGHRDIDSTLGYAHLASAALVKSASRVSEYIDRAMSGEAKASAPRRAPAIRHQREARRA